VGYPVELEAPRPEVDRRSWWAHLRDVPCQDVAVRGERERFLFYDGAVDFPAPVSTSWSDERRRELVVRVRRFEEFPLSPTPEEVSERWWLSARERSRVRVPVPIPAVFVVAAEPGRETRGTVLERLLPAGDPLRLPLAELDLGAAELRRRLLEVLVREGLGGEEARALLATWEKEFFAAPGRRIVTVLPRWMYDALLPLEVFPVPEELVRVGLVWKELE
jgi:hypothetical protein